MKNLILAVVLFVVAFAPPLVVKADELKEKLSAGKRLFETTCNQCHPLADPLSNELSREMWVDRVQEMIGGTGALTPEQENLVVDYLTVNSTYKANCRGCHGLQEVEVVRHDRKGWVEVVKEEVAKKPGLLSIIDMKKVAEFLFINYGK